MKDLWNNDNIQFCRLLAELDLAGGFTNKVIKNLCEAMDLDKENILELRNRSQNKFDKIKASL